MTARMIAGLVAVALASPALAQIDDRVSLAGGYELYTGLQLSEAPDFLAARNRADVQLVFRGDRGRVVVHPRLTFDALDERLIPELREAYADVFLDRVDLRIGHQVIAWGRTDGAFITDLLAPLDLSEFLAQPFEDLRLAVTALNTTVFLGDLDLSAVIIPRRPSSRIPEPGSPWFPAPATVLGAPVVIDEEETRDRSLRQSEVAIRATWRGLPRTDLSLIWMNGFNRIPAFRKGLEVRLQPPSARVVLEPTYRRRHVIGLTGESLVLDPFVVRTEAAFHSRYLLDQPITIPTTLAELTDPDFQDALGRGFLVEKPFLEASLGIDRSWGLHTVGVQGIGRLVLDHDERVAADQFEPAVTALWVGRFRRETVTARVFGLYNLGKDYWINPEVTYGIADGLNASGGMQLFGGRGPDAENLAALLREPAFRFSTFRDNSFGYLRLAYRF